MNIWPRSEASRANVKFWGQSLSQGHYQPIYQQAGKGFIYFITLPLIFFAIKPRVNMVKKPWWSGGECARDWREEAKVNLIGLTNFISTVLWIYSRNAAWIKNSKTWRVWFIYSPTNCSKTWLERNVFQSQNSHLWNTECVKSVALEGGLIFRRSLAWD